MSNFYILPYSEGLVVLLLGYKLKDKWGESAYEHVTTSDHIQPMLVKDNALLLTDKRLESTEYTHIQVVRLYLSPFSAIALYSEQITNMESEIAYKLGWKNGWRRRSIHTYIMLSSEATLVG